jgi:flagellin-like protein
MNIELPDTNDRGQVGIGTLIIFIALVLVSAVAAGVLIDTSGQLESRASDTGEDAQAQVSNQIDVVSATAQTSGSNSIDSITLVVKKSPGSDPIDLEESTIQYTAGGTAATLTQGGSPGFTVSAVSGTTVSGGEDSVLEGNGERVELTISLTQGSLSTLAEGGTAQLKIVDQSGASTVYGVNVPDVLTGDYVQV